MKKYFVAYRFGGEPAELLEERMSATVESLQKAGIDAYCNLFDNHDQDKQALTQRQVMEKAFSQIDESDGLFVLIASSDKSEGQLIEIGYAFAKGKHVIVAVQQDAKTYADSLANNVIRWSDLTDLKNQLEALKT